MKKSEITVGSLYRAKVGNKITTVKVLEISKRDGRMGYRKGGTTYICRNLATNREVVFRSAMKFRVSVPESGCEGPDSIKSLFRF